MTTQSDFENSFAQKTKVYQVYLVLRDQQWHCRECDYTHTGITQIAGGAGIQGLQRGTKSRLGMKIESSNQFCYRCMRTTRQDRWEGSFETAVQSASMAPSFANRVYEVLGKRDIVEGTERPLNQLTIDHKRPMIRWNEQEQELQTNYSAMSDDDIRANFQLLKKSNGSASHNQLKSRACERCFRYGVRGSHSAYPFSTRAVPHGSQRTSRTHRGAKGVDGMTSTYGESISTRVWTRSAPRNKCAVWPTMIRGC